MTIWRQHIRQNVDNLVDMQRQSVSRPSGLDTQARPTSAYLSQSVVHLQLHHWSRRRTPVRREVEVDLLIT